MKVLFCYEIGGSIGPVMTGHCVLTVSTGLTEKAIKDGCEWIRRDCDRQRQEIGYPPLERTNTVVIRSVTRLDEV